MQFYNHKINYYFIQFSMLLTVGLLHFVVRLSACLRVYDPFQSEGLGKSKIQSCQGNQNKVLKYMDSGLISCHQQEFYDCAS